MSYSSEYAKRWRDKQRRAGLCVVCKEGKPEKNKSVCQKCLEKNKELKQARKDAGVCIFCGKDSNGKQSCLRCSDRKRTLGFTPKDRIKASQDLNKENKKCGICGSVSPSGSNWCLDHNHKTNKYRGILCHNCNTALGLLKDSVRILKKAIQYLKNK